MVVAKKKIYFYVAFGVFIFFMGFIVAKLFHELNEKTEKHEKIYIQPIIQQITPQEVSPAPKIHPHDNPEYPMRRGVIPADYQQIGILTSKDYEEEPIILPLFGRKMINRDRWEYYTASDKYNMWRLPVQYMNRDCQSDVGCEEVYDGVEVVLPEYANKVFIVKMYKYGNRRG